MRPYDWCDPRCPNPCSCAEMIEANVRALTQEERDKLGITWKPTAVVPPAPVVPPPKGGCGAD